MRYAVACLSVPLLSVALAACSSPQGPVAPEVVWSPPTNVVLDPRFEEIISFPEGGKEQTTFTADGRMHYQFQLQNRTEKQLRIRCRASFFDESGVLSEPEQGARIVFVDPYEIKTIDATASNSDAKSVKVQVSPAN